MAQKINYQQDDIESQISKIVIDGEYETAKRNKKNDIDDYEASIDMLEGVRSEKDYDWMSDISLNEFASTELTQNSIDSSQYFQTRDYVEVYLEDSSEEATVSAASTKECINRTLNQKHLHYYQKFMRARINNDLGGYVYTRCWWEQKTRLVNIKKPIMVELDVDEYGNDIIDPDIQVRARKVIEIDDIAEEVITDRFNFDIVDPRNVFTDNTYVYSLQDKKFVSVRFEKTLNDLKQDTDNMGYFNLDVLKEMQVPMETETSKESFNKDDKQQKMPHDKDKPYDIVERHGLFWINADKEGRVIFNKEGRPEAGIKSDGEPLENAVLQETIITHALSDSHRVLIRFQLQPYKYADGKPFKPVIRGLCYIHPSKDTGLGDGKYSRELQIAIDDTFNLGNDRTRLATMPTLKRKKYTTDDNTEIYFEPGHDIPLEDVNDLVEMKIDDNITGALQQISMLTGKMHQIRSIYPTTMGDVPSIASTTATAVAGAEGKSNMRANYKSLTFEHTLLTPLYDMILQMTWQFAKPETGFKLMGEKVFDFNPSLDYTFKPLSQSIEVEHSKTLKKRELGNMLPIVAQIPNPKAPMLFNFIVAEIFKLMGDEYEKFSKFLLDEKVPFPERGAGSTPAQEGVAVSNQNQIAMSGMEEVTREAISE